MPHISASEALSHITVLDLTRVRSGPTAVRQLADWGANVIKIEPPESIEPDGSLGASRDTADFQNLHRNKRSLTLNLKDKKLNNNFLVGGKINNTPIISVAKPGIISNKAAKAISL